MEIKVKATKMLEILRANGASETEAKAIIFDLIVESNEQKIRPSKLSKEEVTEAEELMEEATEEESVVAKPTTSGRKRINFSTFGGEAQPLT